MAVLDAQHFRAVVAVAPALLPDLGRLDGWHQQFDGAGPVLLLAHDLFDLLQDRKTQRQPGIDAGARLADHARPQHKPVGYDFRFLGIVAKNGQEILAKFHELAPPHVLGQGHTVFLAQVQWRRPGFAPPHSRSPKIRLWEKEGRFFASEC